MMTLFLVAIFPGPHDPSTCEGGILEHDPEKLQPFRRRSCSRINEMRARCDVPDASCSGGRRERATRRAAAAEKDPLGDQKFSLNRLAPRCDQSASRPMTAPTKEHGRNTP